MARRDEPFPRLVRQVMDDRKAASEDLCTGKWETLSEGKALVAEIKALDLVIEHMRTISGPDTDFGERDL